MNDLISRQAAIDAVNEALKRVFVDNGEKSIGEKIIGELPSAQQWIPISSNPITTGLYLVLCNEWGKNRYRICAYYEEVGKWIENGKNIAKFITHWMPLPEPWKGGETK